jgi:hypothetical protein
MANLQGDQPWIDDDPSRPNDAYFKHVDELVRAADREGLILAMQVSWGWFVNEAQVLNAKNARPYGRWLGERYREAGNVVWVLGGDRPASGFEEVWREVAAGLREGDGGAHLVTYHPCGGRSSADYFQDATLSFDMIQTWAEWSSIYPDVLSGALRTPTRPVVHAEGAYEEGPEYPTGPITPLIVRRQAWWAVLAGGFHTYGHNQMWRLERGFERALDAPGSVQVGLMKRVLTSRDWWDLVPDEGIFASGTGSGPTLNAAARSLNGDVAIVYFSSPGTAVLHLDHIAGGRARATWISPVTGQCRAAGSYDTGNAVGNLLGRAHKRAFSVPWSWEDAVLLLEAAPG